ncbi:MAG: SpoIIE family protein phosphatase [Spirochaetes bacterium]|nr:SpoIIE family protein phosphatase [Spirochaetota bacterium]
MKKKASNSINLSNLNKSINEIVKNIRESPDIVIEELIKIDKSFNNYLENFKDRSEESLLLLVNIKYNLLLAYFYKEDFNEVIKYIDIIKNYYSKYKLKKDITYYKILITQGIMISEAGYPIEGIKIFKNILKKIKNKNLNNLLLTIYNNIGESYNKLHLFKRALFYYKKSLSIAKIEKDNYKYLTVLTNLSSLYIKIKKYNISRIFSLKGIKISKLLGEISLRTLLYKNLSLIKLQKNDIKKALIYINRSIFLAKKGLKKENIIEALLVKLNIYSFILKNFTLESNTVKINTLNKIKKISFYIYKKIKKQQLFRLLPDLFLIKSQIYESINDFKNAFIFYEKYLKANIKLKSESFIKENNLKEKSFQILKDLKEKELFYLKFNKLKKLNKRLNNLHTKRKNEIKIVKKIYNTLILPETPFIPGIHIYTNFKAGKDLSGDFYYFTVFSPTKIGVFIADICGHGIYPSFCTLLLKMFFNINLGKFSNENDIKSSFIINQINKFITYSIKLDNYITAFYCIIDIEKKIIDYCSAGHTPQLFFSDGNIILLKSNSPFIGIKEDLIYFNNEIHFNENSCIILFTDGIIENRLKDGTFFEIDKLINYFFSENNNDDKIKDEGINKTNENIDHEIIKYKIENIFSHIEKISKSSKFEKRSIKYRQTEKDDSTIIGIAFK